MCGICGFTYHPGERQPAALTMERMLDSLGHRGPDGRGSILSSGLALGHTRLSILDIEGGVQPMISPNGNVITFNGEIYNYLEIKKDLEQKGHTFTTTSDTEVLLAAYEAYGTDCLEHFIGMYAFVIHDKQRNRLFMARDRLGKKPFYYFNHNGIFIFASEIKGILAHPAVRKFAELDMEAIQDYLSIGYILSPKSIFKHIRKLPAANRATLDLKTISLATHDYWDLASAYTAEKLKQTECTPEAFLDQLENAVAPRLRSDVPLGTFLSGGIDSSTITACVKKLTEAPVNAYCCGFEDRSFDESGYAQQVAERLQTPLEILAGDDNYDLSKLIWHLDEPFCDTSLIPTYLVCKAARKHVKVVLSGDGADEILAGYSTYMADRAFALYRFMPSFFGKGFSALAKLTLPPSHKKVSFEYKLKKFIHSSGLSREEAHYFWRTIFTTNDQNSMVDQQLQSRFTNYSPTDSFLHYFSKVPGAHFLDRAMYVDAKTWLVDDILTKVDRMSMATSLEIRCPFLDHRIVEFAARLPMTAKVRFLQHKSILKRTMHRTLPNVIVNRAKQGFNFPTMTIDATSYEGLVRHGIVSKDFALDPKRDNITFKHFSLIVLSHWINMYDHYKKTGRWES